MRAQVQCAIRHGVPHSHRLTWLRRKFGAHMVVWRPLADGSQGCSVPCVMCRKTLLALDVHVHAFQTDVHGSDTWFHGRLSDRNAPRSKPTSGQVRNLGFMSQR